MKLSTCIEFVHQLHESTIPIQDFHVLLTVAANVGEKTPLTITDVAERCGMTVCSVGRATRRMSNYVVRTDEGRCTYLDLSPFGRSVVDQLTSIR